MNYIYESYCKLIEGHRFFFVKKFLRFSGPEVISDILEGYGMHPEFRKACLIAGVRDEELQKQIFSRMRSEVPEAVVVPMMPDKAVVRSITG